MTTHIIATIGSNKIELASLEDAQKLLEIIDRSAALEESYDLEAPYVYYSTGRDLNVEVKITHRSPTETAAAERIIAEKRDQRAAERSLKAV